MQLILRVILGTALGVPVADANAKDYQLRHQSLAALATHSNEVEATKKKKIDPLPTVEHQKEAGKGYVDGSPLYERQQEYLTSSTTAAPWNYETWTENPMDEAGKWWWKSLTHPYTAFSFLLSYLVHVLFIFACGWFYHFKQHEPWMKTQQRRDLAQRWDDYERNTEKGTRAFPQPFGGGEPLPFDYCLMTICCYPLRWAETMTSDSRSEKRPIDFLKTFFAALGLVVVCEILEFWTLGFTGLVLWAFVVYGRTRLRKIHGIDPSTKNLFIDACCWYGPCVNAVLPCCFCYATVEEAKLVDRKAEVKF